MKQRTAHSRRWAAWGTAVAAALALTGCAGSSPAPADPAEPEQMTIATIAPGTASPGIVLGIEAGIYREHGIDLVESQGPSGSIVISSLIGGEVNTAAVSWVPVIIAASEGVPLTAVSTSGSYVGPGLHGIFVRGDSGIATGADLEGKTVAVNALGSLGELAFRELVESAGGDPYAVNLTELAMPDMVPALEQGNIDAAWLPGPFYMAGAANENLTMLADFADIEAINGLPNVGYVGMQPWVSSHEALVTRFDEALKEAVDHVNSDEALIRDMQVRIGGLPEELAAVIALEEHSGEVPRETVQRLVDVMEKWGVIEKKPDMDVLYPQR